MDPARYETHLWSQMIQTMGFLLITYLPLQIGSILIVNHPLARFAVVDLKTGAVETHKIGYRGRRGTQICGLGKASDGSIYGTNIIGMHLFRHDPRTGRTRDLGHCVGDLL